MYLLFGSPVSMIFLEYSFDSQTVQFFSARFLTEYNNSFIRTNARMINIFTSMARLLRNTDDNIAILCSVNTIGLYLKPIFSELEVPNWDLQFLNSSSFISNIKSMTICPPPAGDSLIMTLPNESKSRSQFYQYPDFKIFR